jgi:hypothetical protein
MKKFLTIVGFLVILFPSIGQAMQSASVVIDIPLFPEAPQGKLISGANGEVYVAFTLEEYSKIVDDYKGIYNLKLKLLNAEELVEYLNKENYDLKFLNVGLENSRNYYIEVSERQHKRFIASSIILTIGTAIASGFIGAALERTYGN